MIFEPRYRSITARYGIAVLAVALAIGGRLLLDPIMDLQFPYALLFIALLGASWIGGLGPGLFALVAGAVGSLYFLVPPRGTFGPKDPQQWAGLMLYLATGLGIVLSAWNMRIAMRRVAQHAEADLRAAEERFRLLVEGTTDYAMMMLDPQGNVVSWNPGAERITQYRSDEIVGRHVSTFYEPEDVRRGLPQRELDVAAAEGRYEDEGRRVRKDGSRYWSNVVVAALRGEDGRLRGYAKITRDVTEKRKAEESDRLLAEEEAARRTAEDFADVVQQQREQLRITLQSIGDAVISTDAAGRVTFLNPIAERLTGWTSAEATGRPLPEVFRIVNEQTRRMVENPAERALREGVIVGLANHTILLARDGRETAIDDSAAPIRDSVGTVIGAVLVFRDVAERRKTEQTAKFLAEAGNALAAVADFDTMLRRVARLAIPYFADWVTIDLLEADGTLRRVAVDHADPSKVAAAEELHRLYPPDPDASRGIWRILKSGESELAMEITDELLRDAFRDEELVRRVRALGLTSYIGVPILIRGTAGGVITFACAESGRNYDPSDLAVAEDLASRAAVALENARLYGELQTADRRKDQFLAILAHELRNPLAPIFNGLHVLRLAGGSGQAAEQTCTMMERQLSQMARLVDDLLDVSRINSDKLELRCETVELAAVLQSAVETSRPQIEARGHELTVAIPARSIYLDADFVRLAQVFSNLLNNAARYTERGGRVSLTVECREGEAIVSVRDTGIGIPPDMLDSVFELFMQLDRAVERRQGGLGIGLMLVKRLVEMHGGAVEARSEGAGRGSEFVVRLPAVVVASSAAEAGPAKPPAADVPSRRRVLVVDDNRDAALTLSMLVRVMGGEVRSAHDGRQALVEAEQFRPDVILLDLGLPEMDGLEVCRRVRELPWGRGVLLVALTGWGQDDDRRRSREAGFDRHLVKPVDADLLDDLLRDAKPSQA